MSVSMKFTLKNMLNYIYILIYKLRRTVSRRNSQTMKKKSMYTPENTVQVTPIYTILNGLAPIIVN